MIESPDIIQRLKKLIENGGSFPAMFDKSLVPRSRALELVEVLMESLPVEIEQANTIVGTKEDILEDARRQAGNIVDDAVRKAEQLVDADEITRQALDQAEEIRVDTDKYVLEKLKWLEGELSELVGEVRGGMKAVGSGELDNRS